MHSSMLGSHGQLRSSKCLVDSRWTVKISGYGLSAFRSEDVCDSDYVKYRNQLWTAPELLRMDMEARPKYGTQKGDVYSFGIIMQEIVFRALPFFEISSPKGMA